MRYCVAATHPPRVKSIGWTVLDIIKMQTDAQRFLPFIRAKNMFRPLPPKLRIFDVELYRSSKNGIRTSPSAYSINCNLLNVARLLSEWFWHLSPILALAVEQIYSFIHISTSLLMYRCDVLGQVWSELRLASQGSLWSIALMLVLLSWLSRSSQTMAPRLKSIFRTMGMEPTPSLTSLCTLELILSPSAMVIRMCQTSSQTQRGACCGNHGVKVFGPGVEGKGSVVFYSLSGRSSTCLCFGHFECLSVGVFPGGHYRFSLWMLVLSPKLVAIISRPVSITLRHRTEALIRDLGDCTYQVEYTPYEEGEFSAPLLKLWKCGISWVALC